jgi:phosphoserine phosphatase
MENMLTLIADPAQAPLERAIVAEARAALNALGGDTGPAAWLADGIACDIPFAMLALEQADAAVRAALAGTPCDLVAQPAADRRKRLLVVDLDGTAGRTVAVPTGLRRLARTMAADGARTVVLADVGPQTAEKARRAAGADAAVDSRKTGKTRAMTAAAAAARIPLGQVLAVASQPAALPMLRAAGLGVAFHAGPAVTAWVRARLDHADLTALLYVQGYRPEEFGR